METKKFIYTNDKETAEKLQSNGAVRVTLYMKNDQTTWVFQYEDKYVNVPLCFVTNKLFF